MGSCDMPKTAKIRNDDYYIEERKSEKSDDIHYLIGKRDGSSRKMHAIVDKDTGDIRVEDNQIVDDEVANRIVTFIELPNGKVIRNAREVVTRQPEDMYTLEYFVYLLDHSSWYKEFIDHEDIWFCKNDTDFQIKTKFISNDFNEPWAKVYPDKTTGKYAVCLIINRSPIKELIFVSCDGGRIFVSWPDIQFKGDKRIFNWNKNSIGYKVMKIIGEYYIYNNIKGVAARSHINIIN